MQARAEEVVAQHDDSDIDQVVGDEHRSEQLLFISKQCADTFVGKRVARINFIKIGWRQGEEGYFGRRSESRNEQKHTCQHDGDDSRY